MTIDYIVRYVPMPYKVKECVTRNEDDSYTIFINVNIGSEAQEEAFTHAINHIIYNDFNKANVQEIEIDARNRNFEIVDNFRVKEV